MSEERMMAFMRRVLLLKDRMKDRRLTRARTDCTVGGCDGIVHATLNGRKQHIHARCDKCDLWMME